MDGMQLLLMTKKQGIRNSKQLIQNQWITPSKVLQQFGSISPAMMERFSNYHGELLQQ